ncbi:DnaJ C-terminal domain-containing protein [Glycomyces sp. NPDC046736]|uniref:DnaJ C-terminal domain-containing protein n=1 Tax=Glycomyces sp. NPDC046736 TaxID=3155615 RepID=UPI0033F441F3
MPRDEAPSGAVDLPLTLTQIAYGGKATVNVAAPGPCVNCEGSGREDGQWCNYCDGSGSMVVERDVTVRIKPGLADGDTVMLPAEGADGVIAIVRETPHPVFTRDGADLHTVLDVEPEVLEDGDILDIETLGGEAELRVPAGTADGAELRLTGEGMPGPDGRGDLIVELRELAAPPPEEVREARRIGSGRAIAGAAAVLAGLITMLVAIGMRANTEICTPSEEVRCVVVVNGVARGEATPGEQRDRADLTMFLVLVPGAVVFGFGMHSLATGLRRMGEHRAEAGQRRAP